MYRPHIAPYVTRTEIKPQQVKGLELWNQVISNSRFESPCSTKGENCRFSPLWSEAHRATARGFLIRMAELSVAFSPPSLKLRRALLAIHPRPSGRGILAKESNGPQLHGGTPIGPSTLLRMVSLSNHFVPASRGGVYIKLSPSEKPMK